MENNRQEELRSVNKMSHKISKPNNRRQQQQQQNDETTTDKEPTEGGGAAAPQQHQPPVYNINKNDFREVVQKLTGSPAHHYSAPPPKPVVTSSSSSSSSSSSRLHRIRPPPLSQVSPLPALPLAMNSGPAVMSPLPPFPSVHAAAESPISAYLRFFQSSGATAAVVMPPPSPLAFGCHPSPLCSPHPPVSPVPSPGKNE